jgi:hypothetical protein
LGANIYLLTKEKHDIPAKDISEISDLPEMYLEQVLLASNVYNSFISNRLEFNSKLPILIYRYSYDMCQACVYKDLEMLNSFQGRIGKENILVLPSFPENRSYMIQLKNDLASFNYKNMPVDSLSIPTDEIEGSKRYFALINNEGNIEMVFFPRKGQNQRTRIYFNEIEKRLKTMQE